MDDAERWLYFNDPEYVSQSQRWKHVKTGTYVGPAQEIPVGGAEEVEGLVARGYANPIKSGEWRVCERPRCTMEFQAVTNWQRYCSELCQQAEKQRQYRERKRAA